MVRRRESIEPATFRSAVKRSTVWANPAAVTISFIVICVLIIVLKEEVSMSDQ